jgi:Spy/CpxP family protein refolding chaperone
MKKMMMGLTALLAVTISFAQPGISEKPQGEKHSSGGQHMGRHKHGGMEFKKLNLTDEQKQQMRGFNESFHKQMELLNSKEDITVKEQRDQREALVKEQKKNFESILTADQKNQLVQIKADAKKKREEMANRRLTGLKEKLSLTDDQFAKIKSSQEATRNKMESTWNNESLDRASKKQQLMAIKAEEKQRMDEVLTPEQKQKMEELKKERHEHGKHFRGKRDMEEVK